MIPNKQKNRNLVRTKVIGNRKSTFSTSREICQIFSLLRIDKNPVNPLIKQRCIERFKYSIDRRSLEPNQLTRTIKKVKQSNSTPSYVLSDTTIKIYKSYPFTRSRTINSSSSYLPLLSRKPQKNPPPNCYPRIKSTHFRGRISSSKAASKVSLLTKQLLGQPHSNPPEPAPKAESLYLCPGADSSSVYAHHVGLYLIRLREVLSNKALHEPDFLSFPSKVRVHPKQRPVLAIGLNHTLIYLKKKDSVNGSESERNSEDILQAV